MHHPQDQERWTEALKTHAAHLAFPDWTPRPGDRTHLYTALPDGQPVTEVAVYRGDTLIHYAVIDGDDVNPFWARVINQLGP